MSAEFRFKQFTIVQDVNPHKVGSDSMILGAWTKTDALRILDIGTGTGILALMTAQQHPNAMVTAIEPQQEAFEEAQLNFQNSIFANRITAVHRPLQTFKSNEKFDLIISNPPYFDGHYPPDSTGRASARHAVDLDVGELYSFGEFLLAEDGKLSIIFPFDQENDHFAFATSHNLFPEKIMRTTRPDGTFKRSLVQFGRKKAVPSETTLVVKDAQNGYSKAYIALTQAFYQKDLH